MKSVVTIVGIPGSGKTSVLKALGKRFPNAAVLQEEPGRFVSLFYSNPDLAFLNQLDYTLQFIHRGYTRPVTDLVLEERSHLDTHHVFTKLMLNHGQISSVQERMLEWLFQEYCNYAGTDLVILLRCDPLLALQRVRQRGSDYIDQLVKHYLELLQDRYQDWYNDLDLAKYCIDVDDLDQKQIADQLEELIKDRLIQ